MAWTGTEEEFQGFIDKHGLTFPQISDAEAAVYDRFDIPVQPALVVIDAAGEVETIFGSVDAQLLDMVFGQAVGA